MIVFCVNIIILFVNESIHSSKDFHRFTTYEQLTKRCINVSGSHLHIQQIFIFSIDILQSISFVPNILWISLF